MAKVSVPFRVEPDVSRRLKEAAKYAGVTLSEFVESLVVGALAARERGSEVRDSTAESLVALQREVADLREILTAAKLPVGQVKDDGVAKKLAKLIRLVRGVPKDVAEEVSKSAAEEVAMQADTVARQVAARLDMFQRYLKATVLYHLTLGKTGKSEEELLKAVRDAFAKLDARFDPVSGA